jgi:hypothetical protein
MISTAWLVWGVIFGAIGMGYFLYGRKQSNPVALVCGVLLMVFPMFVSNTYAIFGVGLVLSGLPFIFRK